MGKVGNRVRLTIQRPSLALVAKFRGASPPDLAEAMNMSGAMREIRPIYLPIPKLVGTAITVRAQPGDSLMVAKALAIAQPGDVIVIDGRGVAKSEPVGRTAEPVRGLSRDLRCHHRRRDAGHR